jgi:hypothetical protein
MSAGRTTWWPKDAAWHRRELIIELGEEFEAAGPFVIDVLSAWAQEQRAAGVVRGGFKTLAREAFVTPSYALSIISRAAEIGALDDLKLDEDGRRFTCRISGWDADQARGRAAVRMAQKRANVEDSSDPDDEPESEECVTEANVLRDVTHSALPNLTKEEELQPPTPKGGNRQRDLKSFDEAVQTYSSALGIEHEDGWHNVKGAIQAGAKTNDEVLAWVQQHRPDVLPTELAA